MDLSHIYESMPASIRNFMLFGASARLEFYELMASLIRDGVPVDACLRRLIERKAAKGRPEVVLLRKWLRQMERGVPFHEAIRDEVPDGERMLIVAGSLSDCLSDGLDQAVLVTKGSKTIRTLLVTKLAEPVALFLAAMGIFVAFSKGMAPQFSKMVPESEWGASAALLLHTARFVEVGWPFMAAALVAMSIGVGYGLSRWTGSLRDRVDKLPIFGLYRTANAAIFLIAISGFLRNGTPLDAAIRKIRKGSTPWLTSHLNRIINSMERGAQPGEAMDTGMLDDKTTDQLYIYSKSANFNTMLQVMGERAIAAGIVAIGVQTAVARVIALAFVGGIVSWIQVSMLSLEGQIGQAPHVSMNAMDSPSKKLACGRGCMDSGYRISYTHTNARSNWLFVANAQSPLALACQASNMGIGMRANVKGIWYA